MKITQPVHEVSQQLQMFNMYFNNNENQYLSIAYGCSQSVSVLDHTDHPGFSKVIFLKNSFAKSSFTLIILYRKKSQSLESFHEMLRYLLETNDTDFVVGDFNIDAFNKNIHLQRVLSNYTQLVKEPTHLSGSLLDHVYVKNSILQEYCVSTINDKLIFF